MIYAMRLMQLKLIRDLGWNPSVTFEEGLAKTIDWYFKNKEWLKNVTSGNIKIIINHNINNIYERNYFSRRIRNKTLSL